MATLIHQKINADFQIFGNFRSPNRLYKRNIFCIENDHPCACTNDYDDFMLNKYLIKLKTNKGGLIDQYVLDV